MPWTNVAKAMKDKRVAKLMKKPTQLKNTKKPAGVSVGGAGAVQIDIAAAKTAKFK